MAALEDALSNYNQSNFDISSTAQAIRSLAAQYGLSESDLAAAVPIYGNEHRAQYNSGYTEGSNYQGIALRAVEDALKARGTDSAVVAQQNPNLYAQGSSEANQRWQATQKDDGGLFGDLGPIGQLLALIPGPQQPFLLAANAANALSQGNLIGAGLNAFGAYSGGWDGLMGGSGGAESINGFDSGAMQNILNGGGQNGFQTLANAATYDAPVGDIPWNDMGNYGYENAFDTGTMQNVINSGLGGVGGSGLDAAEMAKLVADAQAEIATGAAGAVGVGANGGTATASLMNMLKQGGTAALNALKAVPGGASLLSALPTALAGLYGAKVANDQTDAYKQMADQYASYGAPYRQRLSDLYSDPSSFLSSPEVQKPVQMGSDIMARSLSTQGNPVGSGNALQQLQSYSADQLFGRLGQEKDRLGGFGGLSGYNQAAPQAQQSAIQSMSNAPNVIGATASSIFNPQPTLAQTMAQFRTLSGG